MSALAWKRRLGNLYTPFHKKTTRQIILIYHTVNHSQFAVSKDNFLRQIDWLTEYAKITTIPQAPTINDTSYDQLQVAITFDDGYVSLYDQVAPILEEHNAIATVYLNTGWIGETDRKASVEALGHYPNEHFLLWKEVEALQQAGWIIGSHGVNHLDLTQQTNSIISEELNQSKQDIEVRLNQSCEHFAYTWGRFTPKLQNAVKSAGYISAVSGVHGAFKPNSDPFALPRIDVRAEYTLSDFQNVVMGHWDYLGLKHQLSRTLT